MTFSENDSENLLNYKDPDNNSAGISKEANDQDEEDDNHLEEY